MLERYHAHIADDVELLQPTLGEIGRLLLRLEAWRAAERHGSIDAYRDGTAIVIENRSSAEIQLPLTVTEVGESSGGTRSGWLWVAPGTTRVELKRPALATVPSSG